MEDATPNDYEKFRKKRFSAEYMKYWKVKENNFAATIQRFPELWKLFMQLNDILIAEFEATGALSSEVQFMPRLLLTHAHSQFLHAAELFFDTCPHEAYALMRGAIESAVVAEKLFHNPALVAVWISRRDTEAKEKEFIKHFRAKRKENLFTGKPELERLHTFWVQWSELSSHSNLNDLGRRTQMDSIPQAENFAVHYFERDERYACLAAFQGLEAMTQIESLMYSMFEGRLKLHPKLPDMRDAFLKTKELFRQQIIKEWGIQADGKMTK